MDVLWKPQAGIYTNAHTAISVVRSIAGRSSVNKCVQRATWPGYICDFFALNERLKCEDTDDLYKRVSKLDAAEGCLDAMVSLLGTGGNFGDLRALFNAWTSKCRELADWNNTKQAVWDMFVYVLFNSYDTGMFCTENVVMYSGVDAKDDLAHQDMAFGIKLSGAPETDCYAKDEIRTVLSTEFARARSLLAGSGVELAGISTAAIIRDVSTYKRLCETIGVDHHVPPDTDDTDFERILRVLVWHAGKTVRDMIDQKITLSTECATRYLGLLHTTLLAFIQTGMHHADLNGGNILWRSDGCTILDFGIAGHTGHTHAAGVILDRIQDYRTYAKQVYAEYHATFSQLCGEHSQSLPTWKHVSRAQDTSTTAPPAPPRKRMRMTCF